MRNDLLSSTSPLRSPCANSWASARARGGFTLTELLAVVAIIVLLIGSLFVAINAGSRRAQRAKTEFLMTAISTGLTQFQNDFGYLPPVLGVRDMGSGVQGFGRDVVALGQVAGANDVERQQLWMSYTTLAEYLLGFGHRGEDGYGIFVVEPPVGSPGGQPDAGDKEAPPFGIRSPGTDGCWGAVDAPQPAYANFPGYYRARNPARLPAPPPVTSSAWNTQVLEGRVYGPYLDTVDERMLGGLTGYNATTGVATVVTPEQGVPNFDQLPKVMLDYWGQPIAYHRTPYLGSDLKSSAPNAAGGFLNLGDVFVMRPWEMDALEASTGAFDMAGDDGSSASLKSSGFALVSTGNDRQLDRSRRRDVNEYNQDNIVVTGK
jgi:prepilin-type N-terminal cleavage/methylation domain-containing protein